MCIRDSNDPWPLEADGNGSTLELINPQLDNSLSISWASSANYGSPGMQNSAYLSSSKESSIMPNKSSLMTSYPNPFNGIVNIPFILSSKMNSSIIIYNVLGRVIREISLEQFDLGKHSIIWNGKDHFGHDVSTGIYFIQLKNSTPENIQKLIYLK